MSLTRKHFVALAAALKSAKPYTPGEPVAFAQHRIDCRAVADTLARTNPAFNRERFLTACGVT